MSQTSDIFSPKRKEWLDLNLNFSTHPETEDLSLLSDDNAIKRSVRNLLLINRGEKLFNPKFGSNISGSLFENLDFVSSSILGDNIKSLLGVYEPRIEVNNVILRLIDNDISVKIEYSIINRPDLNTQVLETLIERVR